MEIKNITNKTKLILLVSMLAISLVAFNTSELVDAIHPPGRDIVTKALIPGSNTISFRDISNTNPSISSVAIDPSTVKAGFVTIIVTDADANLDLMEPDAVLVDANSTSSGPNKATVQLEETGFDTGTFSGKLILSSSTTVGNNLQLGLGDDICVIYDPDPPGEEPTCIVELGEQQNDGVGRFSAELEGVNAAGTVVISDYPINSSTRADAACPFDPVTHPVDIQLSEGLTADQITVTISYANAILGIHKDAPNFPDNLELRYRWTGIPELFTGFKVLDGIIDTTAKTITATTPPIKSFIPGPTGLVETVSGQYAIGVDGGCLGGGGGGLVRPGLVVNVLAGSGSLVGLFSGGSGGGAKPTFGDASLLVLEDISEGFGGVISEGDDISLDSTKIVQTGDTALLRFELYENQGITNLERFKMFLNFEGENYDTSTMDTHITYKRGGEITIVDPHEKFEKVEIEILQVDPWNLIVNVKIIFKNTFNTSILVDSWDLDRNSGKKLFPDALQVVEPSILLADAQKVLIEPTSDLTLEVLTETELTEIPVWIKSNALWWQQKQIDDSDFMAGIKYLIEKTMIEVDKNDLSNSLTTKEIPVWISDVAGMWADDSISDEEFINIMQWLISKGILQVQQ